MFLVVLFWAVVAAAVRLQFQWWAIAFFAFGLISGLVSGKGRFLATVLRGAYGGAIGLWSVTPIRLVISVINDNDDAASLRLSFIEESYASLTVGFVGGMVAGAILCGLILILRKLYIGHR